MEYIFNQSEKVRTTWKTHSVYAVDGTTLSLPSSASIEEHFPKRKCKEHYPKARLLAAINPFTGQAFKVHIDSIKKSELFQLDQIVNQFKSGDVLLLDRGFQSKKYWATLASKNLFFVNRIRCNPSDKNALTSHLIKSGKSEAIITAGGLQVRLIVQRKKGGKLLALATNLLDVKKYPRKHLLELYKKRWAAETFFKQVKQNLSLGRFHSRLHNGILQEIFATLIVHTLITGLSKEWADQLKDGEQINFTAATEALWSGIRLFIRVMKNPWRIMKQLKIKILRSVQKIRLGRKYERISLQPENKWIKLRRSGNHVRKDHKQVANADR